MSQIPAWKLAPFTAANGVTFVVRLVEAGEVYGLRGCLTHEGHDPLVEFYDTRHQTEASPLGQFVSRYYLSTLAGNRDQLEMRGLDLDGGVASWKVDHLTVRAVFAWLRGHRVKVGTSLT